MYQLLVSVLSLHTSRSISLHCYYPAPGDYVSTTQILTFSSTRRTVTVPVQTIDDGLFEGDEIFEGILSLPSAGSDRVTLRDFRAAATIEDNDSEKDFIL